ncbi:MAG: Fe-S cluster assembly protein SufD [Luteitalea sp.]|nr:Fe-S cluster assembly protein SufD [Luteitalea sp.]
MRPTVHVGRPFRGANDVARERNAGLMKVAEAEDVRFGRFEEFAAARAKVEPSWLRDRRRAAILRFRQLGLPTTREEEWRFTPVRSIATTEFEPATARSIPVTRAAVEPFAFAGLDGPELVFVNGRFAPDISRPSSLPAGVRVTSLSEILTSDGALVDDNLGRYVKFEQHGFTALNTAWMIDAAVVLIPKNLVVEAPIHLLYLSDAERPAAAHPRTLVLVGEGSAARMIESYAGPAGQVYLTNALTEIVVGANAQLDHYKVQRESTSAYHVSSTHLTLDRSAVFTTHSITLGGHLVRNDINALLGAEGTSCTLNGLYLAGGDRLVDNHTAIDHAKPHSESHELYKGVLNDRAHGVFNGKIYVRPDAQKTDAKQTNQVLLLSKDATINTKPQLEIFADDVKCTHGATVGQINDEALFYLRARGIGRDEARQLLIHAFAEDIIERIHIAPVRKALEQALLKELPLKD